METSSSYRRQAISKNPYMFNGGVEYNEDTEWYETRFRQYDPATGRFGGIDPLTHQINGINPYQFAYNDPVRLNDPTGLMPDDPTEQGDQNTNGGGSGDETLRGNFFKGLKFSGFSAGQQAMFGHFPDEDYEKMTDWEILDAARAGDPKAVQEYAKRHGTNDPAVIAKYVGGNYGVDEDGDLIYYQTAGVTLSKGGGDEILGRLEITTQKIAVPKRERSSVDPLGLISRFVGSLDVAIGGFGSDLAQWIQQRPDRLLYGEAYLHPRSINSSDKAFIYANKWLSGTNTIKVARFLKVAGPVATVGGMGISIYKLATDQGDAWDVADLTVNGLGLGATALAAVGLISNPVGWAIGLGVLAYNGYRLVDSFIDD